MSHHSYKQIGEIIVKLIEDEPILDKTSLAPKIEAILKSFMTQLKSKDYKSIVRPSIDQKRQRAIERSEFESVFWKRKLESTISYEEMTEAYKELDKKLKEKGFI